MPSWRHCEEWFPHTGQNDAHYLQAWRAAPLSYQTGQPADATWHKDAYLHPLGHDTSGALFERAADHLMRYHFYPPMVMQAVSDFGREGRWAQVGDRIVQRLHIIQFGAFACVDVVTMNEITARVDEMRRKGFTYTTTQCHAELGEWTAGVGWRETGEVYLEMHAVSKPGPHMARWTYGLARHLQLRAHRLGIGAFSRLVNQVADLPQALT